MNEYTVEDIKVLADMCPKGNPLGYTLIQKKYDTEFFHNMLWAYSKKEWSFVFEVPYDELPLWINSGSEGNKYYPAVEGFLQWRLKIGK